MAQVTDQGVEIDQPSEIVDRLNNAMRDPITGWGQSFPTTPDSNAGVLNQIIAAEIIDLQQLVAAVPTQWNRDTASGIFLDHLARDIGLTRLPASGSTGNVVIQGVPNTFIPAQFPLSNDNNDTVLTDEEYTLNRAQCYQAYLSVTSVVEGDDYTIVINGDSYSYTASSGDTAEDILNNLLLQISSTLYTAEINDGYLIVTYSSRNNLLSVTNSVSVTLYAVGGLLSATATELGAIAFPENTINTLVGVNENLYGVYNPVDFSLGRLRETDEELRQRIANREQATGTATIPSIETTLSQISGVQSVYVRENRTLTTAADGTPPKAYWCTVGGGDTSTIADEIWRTKPAGIETYGDINVVVQDTNGVPQAVYFSRPTTKYAWVSVSYLINDEESFSSENAIRLAIVDYGENMYAGEDLEPTKFYGPIYNGATGIYVTGIQVALTDSPEDTPSYTSSRISVGDTEQLAFDSSRIPVTA